MQHYQKYVSIILLLDNTSFYFNNFIFDTLVSCTACTIYSLSYSFLFLQLLTFYLLRFSQRPASTENNGHGESYIRTDKDFSYKYCLNRFLRFSSIYHFFSNSFLNFSQILCTVYVDKSSSSLVAL